jgi:CAAX protease family protein
MRDSGNVARQMRTQSLERRQFLRLALIVEGGLIVLAWGLSWLLDVPLAPLLGWEPDAMAWGIGATLPLCLLFGAAYWRPLGSYRRIKDFLLESLGPSIAACRWYELLLVAALAGIGEELLFRGVLQTWMESWGYIPSLIVSNIVFALCHAITATYIVLAFAMGLFLGLLRDAPAERSLLAPILTHGLYDFFAFCLLAMDWRRRQRQLAEASPSSEDPLAESEQT